MKQKIFNASIFCLIFLTLLVPAKTNVTCGKRCYSTEKKSSVITSVKTIAEDDDSKALEVTVVHTLLIL